MIDEKRQKSKLEVSFTFGRIGQSVFKDDEELPRYIISNILNNKNQILISSNAISTGIKCNIETLKLAEYSMVDERSIKLKSEGRSWTFKSSAIGDIDWELIAADCTKQNPIIITEITGTRLEEVEVPPLESEIQEWEAAMVLHELKLVDYKKYAFELKGMGELLKEPVYEGPDEPLMEYADAMVPYTYRFVSVHSSLITKAATANIKLPKFNLDKALKTEYTFMIEGQFSEWIQWAKKVKKAPWPADKRFKSNVVCNQPVI